MSNTLSPTHIAIALVGKGKLGAIQVPIKQPNADEVLIKVELASYGAADGHAVDDNFYVNDYPTIVGLVAVGSIVEAGADVAHVQKGDKVGVYTMPGADRATQEYVVAPACRVCKIPDMDTVNPADVTALIDSFVTAWWTLTDSLELPLPSKWPLSSTTTVNPNTASSPVLIWGAGTSSAQYIIQILKLLGFTNIIATASHRSSARAFSLGATHVVDYNDPTVVDQIQMVTAASPIEHAVDTVCTERSMREIAKLVTTPGSRVALLVPFKIGNDSDRYINEGGGVTLLTELPQEHNPFEIGVEAVPTYTFTWESNAALRQNLLISILPELLRAGALKSQPVRLLKTGSLLERVEEAAALVRKNALNGEKAVIDFRN